MENQYTYGKTKEGREKTNRAHEALMVNGDAALYHAYMLIVNKSKETAEKILNTPLA